MSPEERSGHAGSWCSPCPLPSLCLAYIPCCMLQETANTKLKLAGNIPLPTSACWPMYFWNHGRGQCPSRCAIYTCLSLPFLFTQTPDHIKLWEAYSNRAVFPNGFPPDASCSSCHRRRCRHASIFYGSRPHCRRRQWLAPGLQLHRLDRRQDVHGRRQPRWAIKLSLQSELCLARVFLPVDVMCVSLWSSYPTHVCKFIEHVADIDEWVLLQCSTTNRGLTMSCKWEEQTTRHATHQQRRSTHLPVALMWCLSTPQERDGISVGSEITAAGARSLSSTLCRRPWVLLRLLPRRRSRGTYSLRTRTRSW